MKTWLFRFVDSDNKPTGYHGVVSALNKLDLFWSIDEFGDPFSAEVMQIRNFSFCFKYDEKVLEPEVGEWFWEYVNYDRYNRWEKPFKSSFDPCYHVVRSKN